MLRGSLLRQVDLLGIVERTEGVVVVGQLRPPSELRPSMLRRVTFSLCTATFSIRIAVLKVLLCNKGGGTLP
jgi:hypothetical protein